MSISIQASKQLQRIEQLQHQIQKYNALSAYVLTNRPTKNTWSVIEVIKHCIIAQKAYETKISNVLAATDSSKKKREPWRASRVASYLIRSLAPSHGKVKYKMKTLRQFQPILDVNEVVPNKVIGELVQSLKQLTDWITSYQENGVSPRKFNSAIGAIIRFNVPEACEFILSHHERHFVQIENILTKIQ